MCHRAGQAKSAQILLRYGAADWNALHRDVLGDLVFPLQVVIGLDVYGTDYAGPFCQVLREVIEPLRIPGAGIWIASELGWITAELRTNDS